jgi:soluble lytic murein transglycosylase-like protein
MERLTPSACRRFWLRATAFLLLSLIVSCRRVPVPTLSRAFAVKGNAATRADAFMRVAFQGREGERAQAAMLWGLYACDARAPRSALSAFNLARPAGGRGYLAVRRVETALAQASSPPDLWSTVATAGWVSPENRIWVRLRGAEALAARGEAVEGAGLLPDMRALSHDDLGRALVVTALAGGGAGARAERRLAVSFPELFTATFPDQSLTRVAATFSAAEWAGHAQALLDEGQPREALRAATHAKAAAALVGARAALRLHRSRAALAWAARGGENCAECWLERTEAYRQIAWGGSPGERRRRFGEMLQAARRADRLVRGHDALVGRGELLLAEALTELGRFDEAAAHLSVPAAEAQARWEWVARRFLMLQARRKGGGTPPPDLAQTTRGRRLAAYWRARALARQGDRSGLAALAASGFPDLPAQWAAEDLGERGVAVVLSGQTPAVSPPPTWAADLLTAGRVADAVLAWRWELESAGGSGPEWLGLLALANMPPGDGISLLVRAEPRLLSGPWQGLPRSLLERYLPLPFRSELEAAARGSRVPPWLLAGLVRQESAWNPGARSPAGALGLTQLLPDTARELARRLPGFSPRGNLLDPARNLALGAALLARSRRGYDDSWTAALANYNAGEKRVREVWEANGRRDGPEFVESLEIPETWDYVHRVVLLAEGYRILYWPEGRAYPWM